MATDDDDDDAPPPPGPDRDRSGSIDVDLDGPGRSGRRPRASTAGAIVDTVASAADKVAEVAEAVGGKIGDVVGESLTHLPGVPRTRRGRVLARGVVVGFCLVFTWIAVIVGLQLRGRRPPDFRPRAEHLLAMLSAGKVEQVYNDETSDRFQEVVVLDSFEVRMEDLNQSLGKFREVESVVKTETIRGPSGRTGRVDLRLGYERASTRGSVSFRWEDGAWKLLGLSVEVPPSLQSEIGSEDRKRERIQADKDEFKQRVATLLATSLGHTATDGAPAQDGDPATVWREAAFAFQQGISIEAFERTEVDHLRTLGRFRRILDVKSATYNAGQTSATVDCLIEFERATINGTFKFSKVDGVWRLTYYKLMLPLPRVRE